MDRDTYLASICPTREMAERFASPQGRGSTFDADLGWVPRDSVRRDGVHGSRGFYHYEADGARRVIHSRDLPCRIHTYGDSFTHCDQVSDGETWQEYLAAHLQEPIRNYGVGGYSVYQAYRRMRKVEAESGADYLVLNIFDDDHYRNLDAWRSIRMGIPDRYPLPHLKVCVREDRFEEADNPCRSPEDVYRLCDRAYVQEAFRDDPVLRVALARKAGADLPPEAVEAVAEGFGLSVETVAGLPPEAQVARLHTEAALFATRCVLGLTETFAAQTGKKLMVMLSFNSRNMAAALEGRPRFDRTFTEWLSTRPYPVVDMREAFREDYRLFKMDVETYLKRYYIGHHTPAGNFFTAWAVKDRVCEWLHPKPLPYR